VSFITPMRLLCIPEPFDHPNLIFEPKLERIPRPGAHPRPPLRARLAQRAHVQAVPQLAEEIPHAVRAHCAVLDGEICCREPDGRTQFHKLLFAASGRTFMRSMS
jgi:hypothetical protein